MIQRIGAVEESVMKELEVLRTFVDNKRSATGTKEESLFKVRPRS